MHEPVDLDYRLGNNEITGRQDKDLNRFMLDNNLVQYSKLSDLGHDRLQRSIKDRQKFTFQTVVPHLRSAPWILEWSRPDCWKRNFVAGPSGYRSVCSNRQSSAANKRLILSPPSEPTQEEFERLLLDIKNYLNKFSAVDKQAM